MSTIPKQFESSINKCLSILSTKGDIDDFQKDSDILITENHDTVDISIYDKLKNFLCKFAVINNDLPLLVWASNNGYTRSSILTSLACRYGYLDILKYFRGDLEEYTCLSVNLQQIYNYKNIYPCPFYFTCMSEAILNNHIHILDYLKECIDNGENVNSYNALVHAEKSNNKEMVEWVLKNTSDTYSRFFYCTKNGNFEIFNLILSANKYIPTVNDAYGGAVEGNNIEMLEYLKKIKFPWKKNIELSTAIKANNLPIIEWLLTNGYNSDNFMLYAATAGNMELLLYGFEKKFKDNILLCINAGKSGNLKMCQFLKEKGYPLYVKNLTICETALSKKNKEIMFWGYENGCPLTSQLCNYAVINRDLELLKWLQSKHCPLCMEIISSAFFLNYEEIVDYLLLNYSDIKSIIDGDMLRNVIGYNNLSILKKLKEIGIIFNDRMLVKTAIRKNFFEILEFLIENNCPFDDTCISDVVEEHTNLDMFKYVYNKTSDNEE